MRESAGIVRIEFLVSLLIVCAPGCALNAGGSLSLEDSDCVPGSTECVGDSLVICDEEGRVDSISTCEYGCNAERGECNECEPGSTECQDGDIVTFRFGK